MFEFIRRLFGLTPRLTFTELRKMPVSVSKIQLGDKAILHILVGSDNYPTMDEKHLDLWLQMFRSALKRLGVSEDNVLPVVTCHTVECRPIVVGKI